MTAAAIVSMLRMLRHVVMLWSSDASTPTSHMRHLIDAANRLEQLARELEQLAGEPSLPTCNVRNPQGVQ